MYRVSEKEEIKKYMELGKTPSQYYADQEALTKKPDNKTSSTSSLKEKLLSKKEEDGLEISVIEGTSKNGRTYEQVKITTEQGSVPDPRIAGAKIFFDSRLDPEPQMADNFIPQSMQTP